MATPLSTKKFIFLLFALLAAIAGLYHLVGVFYTVDSSPHLRHAVFVVINLLCIYGFLKRPRWFFYFLLLLTLQQFYSHGTYLAEVWNQQGRIHWISVLDLLLLPVACYLVYRYPSESGS